MKNPYIMLIFLLFAAAGFVVGFFPGIDLAVSGWFYQPAHHFLQSPFFEFIHRDMPLAVVVAGVLAAAFLFHKKKLPLKEAAFIPLTFAVGPGLIVNALLKEYYGRARPIQVEPFGGHAHFTSALQITDQCHHNCSFTAGDPSVGFALIAFALILPQHRKSMIFLTLAVGIGLGILRIAQGGHFLSDVLFTAAVTIGSTLLLFKLLFPGQRV